MCNLGNSSLGDTHLAPGSMGLYHYSVSRVKDHEDNQYPGFIVLLHNFKRGQVSPKVNEGRAEWMSTDKKSVL